MKITAYLSALMVCSLFAPNTPAPESVSVKGVHLCCGGCQSIAEDALKDLKGVSGISCDLNTKVISYKAVDQKTAETGIKALAAAGFFGTAAFKNKKLEFPESGAKKGARANSISLTNVHLCCTACVTASQKSLESVKGVTLIDIDRSAKTIKLTGDAVSIPEAVRALNKAGFYCKLKNVPLQE